MVQLPLFGVYLLFSTNLYLNLEMLRRNLNISGKVNQHRSTLKGENLFLVFSCFVAEKRAISAQKVKTFFVFTFVMDEIASPIFQTLPAPLYA